MSIDSSKYMNIGKAMMEYFKKFKSYIRTELGKYDISFTEAITMMTLAEADGQSAEKLLESVSYDKSVMTRTLQSLESKAYVARTRNSKDGRSWIFNLTASGRETLEKVFPVLRAWSDFAFDGFDETEVDEMLASLIKLKGNISKQ